MRTWYASKLSDNLSRTPEGYIVAHRVPIARTGIQEHLGSEIDDSPTNAFGLDPFKMYKVHRSEEDVFDPHTIASFEGKTFTLTHPGEHLSVYTDADHNMGHVQHVERGEPLENGDVPLVADVVIKHPRAIQAIESGTREISCGYSCKYEPLENTPNEFRQMDIAGNHIALVPKGRAGRLVRINDEDAKPKETYTVKSKSDLIELGLYHAAKNANTPEEFGRAFRVVNDAAPEVEEKKKEKKEIESDDEASDKMDRILALLERMVNGDVSDLDDPEEESDDEEPKSEKKADDDGEDPIILDPEERGENPIKASSDKKANDAALKAHLALRPVIAKSNDAAARKAWSKTYRKLKGVKRSNDGYVQVAHAALSKSDSVNELKDAQDNFALSQQLQQASMARFRKQ